MKRFLLFSFFLILAVVSHAQTKASIFTFRASSVKERHTDFKSSTAWNESHPTSDLIVINNDTKTIKFYDIKNPLRLFIIRITDQDNPDTLAKYNATDFLKFKCIDDSDNECNVHLFFGKDGNDELVLYNTDSQKEYLYFLTFQGANAPIKLNSAQ